MLQMIHIGINGKKDMAFFENDLIKLSLINCLQVAKMEKALLFPQKMLLHQTYKH